MADATADMVCQNCTKPVHLTDVDKVAAHQAKQASSADKTATPSGALLQTTCVHIKRCMRQYTSLTLSVPDRVHVRAHTWPCHLARSLLMGVHSCAAQQTPLSGSYVDVRSAALSAARPRRSNSPQNLTQIFELASTQTHIDHPLCAKCLDKVAKELAERTSAADALAQAYEQVLSDLQVLALPLAGPRHNV